MVELTGPLLVMNGTPLKVGVPSAAAAAAVLQIVSQLLL
jgi:hypothetical protein